MALISHEVSTIYSVRRLSWDLLHHLWTHSPPAGGTAVSPISIATALCMLRSPIDGRLDLDSLLGAMPSSPALTCKNAVFAEQNPRFTPNFFLATRKYGVECKESTGFDDLAYQLNQHFTSEESHSWADMKLVSDSLAASYSATSASSHIVLASYLTISLPLQHLFQPRNVMESVFHLMNGATAQIDMMYCSNELLLVEQREEYTAVCLPFELCYPSDCSLIAYLPQNDKTVDDLLQLRSVHDSNTAGFAKTSVNTFAMPKFHTKARHNIKEILALFGRGLPPSYSHITMDRDTAVDQIIQGVSVVFDQWSLGDTQHQPLSPSTDKDNLPCMDSLIFNSPFVFTVKWAGLELDVPLLSGVFAGTEIG